MLIGYMRVSKVDGSQVMDLQLDALLAAGVEGEQIYTDRASGARDDRPGLENCLRALREGDVLLVWRLDRLGRSFPHLVETVTALEQARRRIAGAERGGGCRRHHHPGRAADVPFVRGAGGVRAGADRRAHSRRHRSGEGPGAAPADGRG